jgi:hypothetical protein
MRRRGGSCKRVAREGMATEGASAAYQKFKLGLTESVRLFLQVVCCLSHLQCVLVAHEVLSLHEYVLIRDHLTITGELDRFLLSLLKVLSS